MQMIAIMVATLLTLVAASRSSLLLPGRTLTASLDRPEGKRTYLRISRPPARQGSWCTFMAGRTRVTISAAAAVRQRAGGQSKLRRADLSYLRTRAVLGG